MLDVVWVVVHGVVGWVVGVDREVELGGDFEFVAVVCDRCVDQLFVGVGVVDLGGVEECDVEFVCVIDCCVLFARW